MGGKGRTGQGARGWSGGNIGGENWEGGEDWREGKNVIIWRGEDWGSKAGKTEGEKRKGGSEKGLFRI